MSAAAGDLVSAFLLGLYSLVITVASMVPSGRFCSRIAQITATYPSLRPRMAIKSRTYRRDLKSSVYTLEYVYSLLNCNKKSIVF